MKRSRHVDTPSEPPLDRVSPEARGTPSPKPEDHGLTAEQIEILSRRLQCDARDVAVETLGYILNCRVNRGCLLQREDIVELWDSLIDCHKTREPSNTALRPRFIVLGANPRMPQTTTIATSQLPQCTRALCSFIKQLAPNFLFSTLSIRMNCDKPPHRDTRNGPGMSFILSLERVEGGGIWVADAQGTVFREVHGQKVAGINKDCYDFPLLLDARRKLHATEPWVGPRRLLLTAWTVMNAGQAPDLSQQLISRFGFPLPSPSVAEARTQQSLEASFSNSVQNAASSSLMLQGNQVIQDVDMLDSGPAETHESSDLCE